MRVATPMGMPPFWRDAFWMALIGSPSTHSITM